MHFLQESLLTLSYLFVKNILFIIVVGNVLIVCFSLSFGNLWFKVYIRRFCKTDLLSGIKRTVLCLSQSGTVIVVLIGTSSAAELAAFEDTRLQVTSSAGCVSCSHWKLMRQKTKTDRNQKRRASFTVGEKLCLISSKLSSWLVRFITTCTSALFLTEMKKQFHLLWLLEACDYCW